MLNVRLGEETDLAHIDSLGNPHCRVLFVLASCLVLPNMLLAMQADNYVLLDDIAAAIMRVTLTTTIGLHNASNVEHVAGGMSDSGDL